MQKKQNLRLGVAIALTLFVVLLSGSCRSGTESSVEPVATTHAPSVSDTPEVSALPLNHEAYAAAAQTLEQKTSAGAATLYFIKPGNGQSFRRGTRIQLEAQSSARRELRNVTFFVNGRRIGASSSNPYRSSWWAKDRGRFVITAEATQRGGDRTAASVSVTIE